MPNPNDPKEPYKIALLTGILVILVNLLILMPLIKKAHGAESIGNSSFEVIEENGNQSDYSDSLIDYISFSNNNVTSNLINNVSVRSSISTRRNDLSNIENIISPITGSEQFEFNYPMNDSIAQNVVEQVVQHVPPRIMPRAEVQQVVSNALKGGSLPPIEEYVHEEFDEDSNQSSLATDIQKLEKIELIKATKENVKEQIVRLVEAKKEHIVAEVISYELPASSKTLSNNMSYTNFDIETRLDSLSTSLSGISSGDTIAKHGIWWQLSKSMAKQKETANIDAFKSTGNRVIVGYDILTERDNSYGFAYSLLANNLSFVVGDSSERIRHHNYSLYSNQTLTAKMYAPLSFSYGHASIKTKRDMLWKQEKVSGNTKAKTLNTKVGIAYNLDMPRYKVRLTPQTHLVYESIKVNGFVENGTRISKAKSSVLSSIIGLSLTKEMDIQHSKLIPELQYSYKRKLKGKAQDIKVVSISNDELIASNSQKLNKASHILNSSLALARGGVYSYSLGHQYTKSQDKYTSHTGYLKLRINL